jgi:hypothetical protein
MWPFFLELCGYDKENPKKDSFRLKMTIIFMYLAHNVFFSIGQLMHLFLYKTKIEFFEKYKINPER